MSWVESTLGELCDLGGGEIRTGPFGSQLHQSDYEDEGTPVVMPKNIIDGRIDEEDIARVNEEHVERLSQHKLEIGNIVYGRRGDIGRQALIRKENVGWLCGTGCLKISLGEQPQIDSRFLHLYLKQSDVISWIAGQAVGATMPNLNTSILRSVPVYYPEDRGKQTEIADALFAYDELIENNNRRIAILETIAQNLYREWFINFRFPGHDQSSGQTIGTTEGCPEGASAKDGASKQTQWQETPQGKIPLGWDAVELGELITVRRGKTITKKTAVPEDVPVVAGGLQPAYFHNVANTTSPVITVSASGANAGYVNMYTTPVWASDCSYIDTETTPYVYYYYLLMKDRQVEITRMQTGAAQPHVYPKDLMRLEVLDVPTELLDDFTERVTPIFQLIANLAAKNNNLQQQRDLLLPKLIVRFA